MDNSLIAVKKSPFILEETHIIKYCYMCMCFVCMDVLFCFRNESIWNERV